MLFGAIPGHEYDEHPLFSQYDISLKNAHLTGANLEKANLEGAHLKGAKISSIMKAQLAGKKDIDISGFEWIDD